MGEYIIKVNVGDGIATYRFDQLERAMEIVEKLRNDGAHFVTNFDKEMNNYSGGMQS